MLASLAWWFLTPYLSSGSERFYLLLPPTVGVLAITDCLHRRQTGRQTRFKRHAMGLAFFLLLAVCAACLLGFRLETVLRFPTETLLAAYFAIGLGIVIVTVWFLVRWLVRATGKALAGSSALSQHGWVFETATAVIVAPLLIGYLIGALYVHRFKAPNWATPMIAAKRQFENVSFCTRDSLTLRAWFIPAKQASGRTLLICHGLGANRSAVLPYLDVGDALGANVFMFDFRGHGESDGHTVTLGCREREDVLAALAYLRSEKAAQAKEIIGLGISMGSGALVLGAAEATPAFDALILDSGFASTNGLAENVVDSLPGWFRQLVVVAAVPLASLHAGYWLPDLHPEDQIASARAPVLIIHADRDRMIPAEHAVRLYNHAREPKSLWIAPTGFHTSALFRAGPEYLRRVKSFVEAYSHLHMLGLIICLGQV
jgi:fermentation-respiration switch protein FrsA (DUF1100 family)